MHSTSDFKKGLNLLLDDTPYTIVDFQLVKPGKGNQFVRTKLRNLLTGSNLDRTFKNGEKFGIPDVEYQDMNFLYKDDSGYNFMNQSTYEQICINKDIVADTSNFLTENMSVKICLFNERAVGLELPNSVELKVTETGPSFKGNTVTNTFKPATLETGAVVQVPLHIKEGDLLKINTASCEYVERVNK